MKKKNFENLVELCNLLQLRDGLNAVPLTELEKRECARKLSPQELHQIIIGSRCSLFISKSFAVLETCDCTF